MLFGVIGLFKFKNFYQRILVSSQIDTVGTFTVIIGIVIKHGFGFFSLKLLLLIVLIMILNPLIAHITVRSSYLSGHNFDNNTVKDGEEHV